MQEYNSERGIMGYPDLKSDESIILTAQHIKVKSVPFEMVLTNRRLILIDSEKNSAPTQQIPLVTIRNVATGENAIRDPVLTLTILTDTADTRELALTFAMQTAGERRREAGEWTKVLKKYIAEAVSFPGATVTETQGSEQPRPEHTVTSGVKKKIEISRPIKKIVVDTNNLPPKPVETTSLPEGTFCCRCGNRIPEGSTFCNRCGTKVVLAGEAAADFATPGQIATAPVIGTGSGDRKGRPIEQIIHSIEPLIEDSVPRTESAPAVPEPVSAQPATHADEPKSVPVQTTPAPEGTPAPEAAQVATTSTAPADAPAVPPVTPASPLPPLPPLPPVPAAPRKKRTKILTVAIIAIVIIAIAVGGILVMKNLQKAPAVTPVTTTIPTTAVTTLSTPKPTTVMTTIPTIAVPTTAQVLIPPTGVWVEITYDQTYSGKVGTPGAQISVSDTGDHFYPISTIDGTVAVAIKKTDGSGDELKVVIYKDGLAVKTESTSKPKGTIDLQYSLATPTPTPTPEPTSESVAESTGILTTTQASNTGTMVTVTNSTA